jgi:hypothetical protein
VPRVEKEVAAEILRCLEKIWASLNELTVLSDKLTTTEQGKEMRRKLGAIMFETDDILRPITKEYPELDPDK